MNEYETEEQQVEALKKWLKENMASMLLGLAIGMAGLGGWNYYVADRENHAQQASNLYMELIQILDVKGIDAKAVDINTRMVTDFADTPYASLAAIFIAGKEYEQDNRDEAVRQYEWVLKHGASDELKQLARLRLARLLVDMEKFDEAMSMIEAPHDPAYDAVYEELKGDLYYARGKYPQARTAYDRAIEKSGKAGRWLILKRQNLGENS